MVYHAKPFCFMTPNRQYLEIHEAIINFRKRWLPKHELADEQVLFHYTTLTGIQGILKDRALWCTHISSLNDPLEIQYGQRIINRILSDHMENEDKREIRTFLRKMLGYVQAFGSASISHTYVASFCETGNLLSQWRGYSDSGRGYCVGLVFSDLTRITSELSDMDPNRQLFLRKVIYDRDVQESLAKSYIDQAIHAARSFFESSVSSSIAKDPMLHATFMASDAANDLIDMILSFKLPVFASENEWRLIRVRRDDHQPEELKFRETNDGLVPYIPTYIFDSPEEKDPFFPLRSICFGPMLEPMRTRSALELLLYHIASDSHRITLNPPSVQISGPGYSLR